MQKILLFDFKLFLDTLHQNSCNNHADYAYSHLTPQDVHGDKM